MYSNTTSSVQLNDIFTKWFDTTICVGQGDTYILPYLTSSWMTTDLEQFSAIDFPLSVSCYADDIMILSYNEETLQFIFKSCSWMVFEVMFKSKYKYKQSYTCSP